MFVDASAIIAILTDEPEAEDFTQALDAAAERKPITSVLAVWEAVVGLYRKKTIPMADAEAVVQEFLEIAGIEIVAVLPGEMTAALQAFDRYGRHRYPEADRNSALNLADCFHYATAKSYDGPILTKDIGFASTDLATLGVNGKPASRA